MSSIYNSSINALRRQNQNGVYDIHTNTMQYPANMQPTHARIQQVSPVDPDSEDQSTSRTFPPLQPSVARNFMVTDTYLETPPTGIAPASFDAPPVSYGPDKGAYSSDFLAPFRGLSAISDDIKNELPPECRKAFDEALEKEKAWHQKWGTEKETKSRRSPTIDKAIVPYSMMQ